MKPSRAETLAGEMVSIRMHIGKREEEKKEERRSRGEETGGEEAYVNE